MLFNSNYSIQHYSSICTQWNISKYFYVLPIFQFRHTVKEFQLLLFDANNSIQNYWFVCVQLNVSKYYITNNSIKHHSFVYTQLNDPTLPFLIIQPNKSHLSAQSLNVKQFYLTYRLDSFRCYSSESESTGK